MNNPPSCIYLPPGVKNNFQSFFIVILSKNCQNSIQKYYELFSMKKVINFVSTNRSKYLIKYPER